MAGALLRQQIGPHEWHRLLCRFPQPNQFNCIWPDKSQVSRPLIQLDELNPCIILLNQWVVTMATLFIFFVKTLWFWAPLKQFLYLYLRVYFFIVKFKKLMSREFGNSPKVVPSLKFLNSRLWWRIWKCKRRLEF